MKKKILITAGGTGGHLFPAQSLAQQLLATDMDVEVLFAGDGLETNPYLQKDKYSYKEISSGELSFRKPYLSLINCWRIIKGVLFAWRLIYSFRPDAVVGFGSYHTFPVLIAAKLNSVPIVLHEGNSIIGKVNRFFSRFARITTISFSQSAWELKGKCLRVDFPLREGYTSVFSSKSDARKYFVLHPTKFTFLVFGGSQGALALNTHFCSAVMDIAERTTNFQVLHLTGNQVVTEELRDFYRDLGVDACVRDFEKRMDLAWQAADLAITRAGAATIAELLEMAVPSILIPYPFSADRHQEKNAEFVEKSTGGVLVLLETELHPTKLSQEISALIENERAKLNEMAKGLRDYKQKNRAQNLCSVVSEVAGLKVR